MYILEMEIVMVAVNIIVQDMVSGCSRVDVEKYINKRSTKTGSLQQLNL